ncbi:hypothetical protein TSAR_005585 [Trichomalopsis sarcophagae]|uniref:Uncharacterized protein n=1 Tax=Trichomalopsis sarcophagae TaxID=543379 RepID=A0A232EVY1_9HYME|nr:hypothetical protein TSAR_005585 [Trichomalopsis sarcophagae]
MDRPICSVKCIFDIQSNVCLVLLCSFVCVCVCVCRNISGTTRSISIKFDIHVYFWIPNSRKAVIFYFSNNVSFCGQFLIFEKH